MAASGASKPGRGGALAGADPHAIDKASAVAAGASDTIRMTRDSAMSLIYNVAVFDTISYSHRHLTVTPSRSVHRGRTRSRRGSQLRRAAERRPGEVQD